MYLLCKRFRFESDNKAVSLILCNPLAKPPAVIQHWALRLSHFDFEVKHRAGKRKYFRFPVQASFENLGLRDSE